MAEINPNDLHLTRTQVRNSGHGGNCAATILRLCDAVEALRAERDHQKEMREFNLQTASARSVELRRVEAERDEARRERALAHQRADRSDAIAWGQRLALEAVWENRAAPLIPSVARHVEAALAHETGSRVYAELGEWRGRAERAEAALRELCRWKRTDGDCWCETPGAHSPGCLAARSVLAGRKPAGDTK